MSYQTRGNQIRYRAACASVRISFSKLDLFSEDLSNLFIKLKFLSRETYVVDIELEENYLGTYLGKE